MQSDPQVKALAERLRKEAAEILDLPPVVYKLEGPRLLAVSREALRRISTLAGIHRLTGEMKYADRAVQEMLAVCAFKDWHPPHFLDTAEMCAAVAIGYDWLFDQIQPADRETIRQGIINHALKPAFNAYEKGVWWTKTDINWAQVCSGGLILGALAIAEDEPAMAAQMLDLTRPSMVRAMSVYAPDGGYAEGPGYWTFGTTYNVLYLAALQTAMGTDFGLSNEAGFAQAGFFRIQTIGPTGKRFNFADCGEGSDSAWCMFWLARQFNQPAFSVHERTMLDHRPGILHLFWFDDRQADLNALPTSAFYKHVHAVSFRNNWSKNATFIGIKGGDNAASHGHLDLGSFVLDALGERWAIDLGPDDYNLPGYFGKNRWDYYRLRTEGHNTLLIDERNQELKAMAPVTAFNPRKRSATIDLAPAYGALVKRADRFIALGADGNVELADRIVLEQPRKIRWTMHTRAKVTIDDSGQSAMLSQNGKSLHVALNGTDSYRFSAEPLAIPSPQRPVEGVTRLVIRMNLEAGKHEWVVSFKPER